MKVLIAEDDLTSRKMLGAILGKWGYGVVTAADGKEAWAAMQADDLPQLVILDWMMPGMDGLTLCRKLRAQNRHESVYIILLTAKGERQDVVRGLEAGADDYIAKPYDNQELRARLNVGRRILELQIELRNREKLQGVLEMAGAVCHELSQPLQAVSGYSELIAMNTSRNSSIFHLASAIEEQVDRIGAITRKLMRITNYKTKPYIQGRHIIDIDKASTE